MLKEVLMEKQGNNIFSKEEEQMAAFLKEKNLEYANSIAAEVHPRNSFYTRFGKRALDLIIIIPIIIILSPVYLVLAILNLIDMGRPILYKQTRYGYKGRNYNILKFRSMKNAVDSEGRQLPPSQRLTAYGRFIRKYSLDELPNLFNILRGEMSIIGPRAVPIFYMERMTERHKMMSAVRPGLECPRVINIESDEEISNYMLTFENNIWYAENISFMTDVKMVLMLVKMVFTFKERSMHADAASFFVGYDDKGFAISTKLALAKYADQLEEKISQEENILQEEKILQETLV